MEEADVTITLNEKVVMELNQNLTPQEKEFELSSIPELSLLIEKHILKISKETLWKQSDDRI